MMAEAGYEDQVIMRQGRWHSEAFRLYSKTRRGSRLEEQKKLAITICNMTRGIVNLYFIDCVRTLLIMTIIQRTLLLKTAC